MYLNHKKGRKKKERREGGGRKKREGWGERTRNKTKKFDINSYIYGILNVTPDSFSDGGAFMDVAKAVSHANELVEKVRRVKVSEDT